MTQYAERIRQVESTVPPVQDSYGEIAEVLEDGHGVLKLQKLFLLVLEESEGEAEDDLWRDRAMKVTVK